MQDREFKDALFTGCAEVCFAFASPKRLEIIDLLGQGERHVESIASVARLSVANASRHLQLLKAAGLVESRKDGLRAFYRLADPDVARAYRTLTTLARSRSAGVGRLVDEYFADADRLQPMTGAELLERVAAGDVTVIDVRPAAEYAAGHVAGARSIPLSALEQRLEELPTDKPIVAYCRGPFCVLSADAVRLLRAHGREAVRLADGYPEWLDAGMPVGVGAGPMDEEA